MKKSCVELESESATAVLSWLRSEGREGGREGGSMNRGRFPHGGLPRRAALPDAW